jgi:hypothetical protein
LFSYAENISQSNSCLKIASNPRTQAFAKCFDDDDDNDGFISSDDENAEFTARKLAGLNVEKDNSEDEENDDDQEEEVIQDRMSSDEEDEETPLPTKKSTKVLTDVTLRIRLSKT